MPRKQFRPSSDVKSTTKGRKTLATTHVEKVRWHGWTQQPVRQKSSKNARVYEFLLRAEQKLLTLSLDEFLRCFLLHVLPKGFVRIRNFGWLANRRRATLLPLCFHLLGSAPQTEPELSTANDAHDLRLCPQCGGPMMVIERLTAAQIQLRSPPALVPAAA